MSLIRQKTEGDCGIAALTLYAEVPYDQAAAVVALTVPADWNVPRQGLLNQHVVDAAAQLGVRLIPTRRFRLDTDEGVLRIRSADSRSGHFVAVKRGLILCPTDGLARDWRQYLALRAARPGTLLKGSPCVHP